nr:hypothetical protein Itr_chr01CG06880 [Ipomoea trifida]
MSSLAVVAQGIEYMWDEEVQMISRFQEGFVDRNPKVGTSNAANQTEGLDDNTTRADSNAQTEEVEATSIAETEFSGVQDETSNP